MERRDNYLSFISKGETDGDTDRHAYYLFVVDKYIVWICNKNERTMRIMELSSKSNIFRNINNNHIQNNVIKQLYEDGSRWEGDWYTEQPFGFGSLYDGDGNRIYRGFMFEGKKVGFGEEYFADTHTIDYCGDFMNDKRHGWGITYDRNGNKLYEGDWRFGKNCGFEKNNTIINTNSIRNLLQRFINCNECNIDWRGCLEVTDFANLENAFKKYEFLNNVECLKICNNKQLNAIKTSDDTHWDRNGAFIVIIEGILYF